MDSSASTEEMDHINKIMDKYHGLDVDFHKLRTRQSGGSLHIDLHMGCRPGYPLSRDMK
jgi:divalent metal cation (Fe/Co/Zn/Cd) transporter